MLLCLRWPYLCFLLALGNVRVFMCTLCTCIVCVCMCSVPLIGVIRWTWLTWLIDWYSNTPRADMAKVCSRSLWQWSRLSLTGHLATSNERNVILKWSQIQETRTQVTGTSIQANMAKVCSRSLWQWSRLSLTGHLATSSKRNVILKWSQIQETRTQVSADGGTERGLYPLYTK